jgi:hypothetical protein
VKFVFKYHLESWYYAMLPGEMQQRNAGYNRATIHYTNKGTIETTKHTKRNPGPATTTCKRERN